MSRRAGALAAINGGYFRTTGVARGEPVGLLVKDGRILSEPVRNRASLLIGQGDPPRLAIVFPRLTLALRIGKIRLPVDGINRPREADELVVYTPDYHRTTLTEPGGSELVVRQGRRLLVRLTYSKPLYLPLFIFSSETGWRRASVHWPYSIYVDHPGI
jgi:hypothetical protein